MTERKSNQSFLADLDEFEAKVPIGSKWFHKNSGNAYVVVDYVISAATASPMVVYAQDIAGEAPTWAREGAEFLDGRFERLDA